MGCCAWPGAAAAQATGELPVRLAGEIPRSTLLDVSADGKRLLVFAWSQSLRGFGWQGKSDPKKAPGGSANGPVRIVDLESWRYTFSMSAPRLPRGGFFANGESFYLTGLGNPGEIYHAITDLRTGRTDERRMRSDDQAAWQYLPIRDRQLLAMGTASGPGGGTRILARVEFPTFREIIRSNYCPPTQTQSPDDTYEADYAISGDRRVFFANCGNQVAYRGTEDLAFQWTRPEGNVREVRILTVGVSADGAYAAGFLADTRGVEESKRHYVVLWDGRRGEKVGRFEAFAVDKVALSANGKLVACGLPNPLPGTRRAVEPTVMIYDAASGRKVAALVQDRFAGGNHQFLVAHIDAIYFTPDGQHLVTSGGTNVKVWQI